MVYACILVDLPKLTEISIAQYGVCMFFSGIVPKLAEISIAQYGVCMYFSGFTKTG